MPAKRMALISTEKLIFHSQNLSILSCDFDQAFKIDLDFQQNSFVICSKQVYHPLHTSDQRVSVDSLLYNIFKINFCWFQTKNDNVNF